MLQFNYQPDPIAIEQESFRQIRELADLSGFDTEQQQIVMRLVHSLGEPALAGQTLISANAVSAGCDALRDNAPILCDVEMVRHGLTKRMLQPGQAHCFLNDPEIPALARQRGETRTMAALHKWAPLLDGAVVVIGNAPTALFRLLEMISEGAAKPAVVIGIPVGFVGAAESKQALWQHYQDLGIECITVAGRWGGSALAAAACNAMMRINLGERY